MRRWNKEREGRGRDERSVVEKAGGEYVGKLAGVRRAGEMQDLGMGSWSELCMWQWKVDTCRKLYYGETGLRGASQQMDIRE